MRIEQNLRSRRTLAAAFGLAGVSLMLTSAPSALAQAAGADRGLTGATAPANADAQAIALAANLAEQGRLVEAKATLERLINSTRVESLSDAQKAEAFKQLKSITSKMQTADPVEMSLQKAEFAVTEGDLLQAERQAKAASSRTTATADQAERADAVLKTVSTRRAEISPALPGMIEQARTDFTAQKYAEAKATILTVLRSGVTLGAEQATELERYQLQIVDLERANGQSFDLTSVSAMGTMQPGTVRRPGNTEPLAEPGQGGGEPAPAMVQSEPAPQPVPAAPVAQPVTIPTTSTASSQDDLVTQAMRAEALRIVAEADTAFTQARYSNAADKYSLALAQFRGYLPAGEPERIENRIAECRVRIDSATGGADLARQSVQNETLIRDKATTQFNTFMSEANTRLSEGSPDRAQDLLAQARLAISSARNSFNESEMAAFNKQMDEMRIKIETKRTDLATTEAKRKQDELAATAAKSESARLAERERKVNESIDRVRALQQERKYQEALQVVDQTLFLDPNNPTALLLRDILRDIVVYVRFNEIYSERKFNLALMSLDGLDSLKPPRNIMDFPTDWPAKTFQRGESAAFADTPENRKVLAQLQSPTNRIPLDLADSRFEDVVRFLATVTNLNIDPDWESLASVGVEKDTLVTLRLSPVTANVALDRVLAKVSRDQFAKAGWAVNDGIVTIASDETLRKHRTLVIYNIQDLLFEIPNYRQVPQIDLNSVLQQSQGGGGGGQSPFTGDQNQQQAPPDRQVRIRQIVDIIQANVDFEGWKDNGGETGALQELNGSLIITNTPKNHREIVGLLSKLREIRNMQINVETKFLLVNQNWFEQVGFDLDIIWNANSNQVKTAQGVNPNTQPSDFFNFAPGTAQNGVAVTQGLKRQLGPVPVNPGSGNPATFPAGNPNNWSPIATQQNSLGLANSLAEGDFANAILGAAPALGIAGQFLDDIQVDFLIQATQADQRTVRLTAPRLTFTNGQTANIFVVTQQAFVSDLTPVVGDSAVGFDPEVSVLSEGVTMLVEGVISSDRRYVTLNIDAGVARLDGFSQSSVSAVAGGQLVNSADTQSFIQLPQITVTRVRTTATVPDEGTVLLGGQRLVTEVEVETGVPVLSKIPVINRFFTNRIESKEEQTLLILVKPTILIQTEEEERAFPGLLDSVRTGLGVR